MTPQPQISLIHEGEKLLAHAGRGTLDVRMSDWPHNSGTPPAVAQTEIQVRSRLINLVEET